MIKGCDKCRYNGSNQHKNTSSSSKKSTIESKKNISDKKTCLEYGSTSKINLCKLGESLIKSGYELENALTKLIDAEVRKTTAIMKKYDESKCRSNSATKRDILVLNGQLKNSLYLINEIEEIIELKTIIGVYLVQYMENTSYGFQDFLDVLYKSKLNDKCYEFINENNHK